MTNIVIIGNGFDLAHGGKTSYENFLNDLIKQKLEDNTLFEDLGTFKSNPESLEDVLNSPNDYWNFKNNLLKATIEMKKKNWIDIETIFFKLLKQGNEERIIKLNSELNDIKKYLELYLAKEEKSIEPIYQYVKLFEKLEENTTYYINFNYTSTLAKYDINPDKTIHIHGKLESNTNPIIFGYAADSKDINAISTNHLNEVYRNIKRINYTISNNYYNLHNILEIHKNVKIYVIGHSLGLSDKLILNEILSNSINFGITIFYFDDYEDYFQKTCNIDRIVKQENSQKLIKIFSESHRMAQKNDNTQQVTDFLNYIKKL